jgi:hypothetical protein
VTYHAMHHRTDNEEFDGGFWSSSHDAPVAHVRRLALTGPLVQTSEPVRTAPTPRGYVATVRRRRTRDA